MAKKPDVVFFNDLHQRLILEAAMIKAEQGCKVIIAMDQGDAFSMLNYFSNIKVKPKQLAETLQGIVSYCSLDRIVRVVRRK